MKYLEYLSPHLNLLPIIFSSSIWIIFIITGFFYFVKRESTQKSYKKLIVGVFSLRVFYALILTLMQYYIWSKDKFTQILLSSPIDKAVPLPSIIDKFLWLRDYDLGYFLFYSWGRFWINVFIVAIVSIVFWRFLKLLKKYNDRFFENGEVELGFLTALIVGWPNFIIFVPAVFVSVVLVSIFRKIFKGELYTTLGAPFIFAALIALVFGGKLIEFLHLGPLKI